MWNLSIQKIVIPARYECVLHTRITPAATMCIVGLFTGAEYGITSDGFFELEDLPK